MNDEPPITTEGALMFFGLVFMLFALNGPFSNFVGGAILLIFGMFFPEPKSKLLNFFLHLFAWAFLLLMFGLLYTNEP